jgi:hypothetical protein
MPITYQVDQDRRLIYETWTGEVEAKDLGNYWKRYLADPAVLVIRRTIVDLRGTTIKFNGSELEVLIETIVVPALGSRKWITALVVRRGSVEFGVGRQYHVFAERFSRDSIFFTMAEAEKWMSEQPLEAG